MVITRGTMCREDTAEWTAAPKLGGWPRKEHDNNPPGPTVSIGARVRGSPHPGDRHMDQAAVPGGGNRRGPPSPGRAGEVPVVRRGPVRLPEWVASGDGP